MGDLSGVGHINILSHVNSEILKGKMEAWADQRERITASECPILQDIDGDVAKVLSHHGLLPIEEIVTAIADFIPADDVKLCRKYLFESAKGVYYESLENEKPGTDRDPASQVMKRNHGACHPCTRCCAALPLYQWVCEYLSRGHLGSSTVPCSYPDTGFISKRNHQYWKWWAYIRQWYDTWWWTSRYGYITADNRAHWPL